jgi:RNA polymerase sigma factor (sigma-70 family)
VIKLLIVDDHAVVRDGLAALVATAGDIQLVGQAAGGEQGILMAESLSPDVVLMDLSMPDVDGVAATRAINSGSSKARVVILTSFSERERIMDAIDAGAIGYLLKDAEPEELIRGVRAAAAGDSPFSPKAAGAILQLGRDRRAAVDELRPRERDVLLALCEGLPNKQIARRLGISEKTVKSHLTSIFQRVGVEDRTQAVLWAQRNGLVGMAPEGE